MNPEQQRLLQAAPEIMVLDLTDSALATLITALLLEHPTADDVSGPGIRAPSTLRRARQLLATARRLRDQIERYRLAVDRVVGRPAPHDLPF
jgi:hypothetical protein